MDCIQSLRKNLIICNNNIWGAMSKYVESSTGVFVQIVDKFELTVHVLCTSSKFIHNMVFKIKVDNVEQDISKCVAANFLLKSKDEICANFLLTILFNKS